MLALTTKRAVLPLVVLLITINAFCQNPKKPLDSIALKKELDAVLAKYGLKSTGFAVNVISLNQKGGQNAYSITNNYYQNITVTQQPELGDWYKNFFMRHIEQVKRDSGITSNHIIITIGSGSNAGKFVEQLRGFLKTKGYETDVATSFDPFTGVGVYPFLYYDNKTKIVGISIGNISQ